MILALALAAALTTQEVRLETPTGALFGTIQLPASASRGKVPVVLLIAGSGPTDRDGNTAGAGKNDSLEMLAAALAENGIASLRYDKRGIGASAGAITTESELRFETYVDDAAAWAKFLRADDRFSRLMIAGHSEGSLLGMLAAQKSGADRVVSIAGPGRPAGDLLLTQLDGQLTPSLMESARAIIASLVAGRTTTNVPPELAVLFRASVQPYLISWFAYDPAAEAAKLGVPLLIVQGTTDLQVSVDDARLLAAAQPGAKLVVIDGMNHVLKDVPADRTTNLASYSDPTLPADRKLVDAITAFAKPAPPRRRAS